MFVLTQYNATVNVTDNDFELKMFLECTYYKLKILVGI